MTCLSCGYHEFVAGKRSVPYRYKGKETVLLDVDAKYCAMCGDINLSGDLADDYIAKAKAFQALVDADYPDAKFIADVRIKLHLTQREASKIIGGGNSAFSQYEAGKRKASRSTMMLLQLLDMNPDLLNIIR
ncbi:type II TA system antitoxin MqsA family protein [Nissabacter sp. SGAir0207]|uniref:type II TA system antitoxin MqsA family protein n=1 Tax=Nissabacter sp. SGAir0207 TaxID=2126321 RepID=UPI0010CD4523|nr:type II TA system antitoxin MqsA family protein [Nissabacter sp. SGAir0207]QCR38711.1 antitoxin [Nissabacter sp. SGAir0207]